MYSVLFFCIDDDLFCNELPKCALQECFKVGLPCSGSMKAGGLVLIQIADECEKVLSKFNRKKAATT